MTLRTLKDGEVVAQLSSSRLSTPSLKLINAPAMGATCNSASSSWVRFDCGDHEDGEDRAVVVQYTGGAAESPQPSTTSLMALHGMGDAWDRKTVIKINDCEWACPKGVDMAPGVCAPR